MISKLRRVASITPVASGDIGVTGAPVSSNMVAYVYGRKIQETAGIIPFINRLEEPLNCICGNLYRSAVLPLLDVIDIIVHTTGFSSASFA